MPRCAVFTIVGNNNYGNRLLCAATCKILASLGVDAEIILVKDVDYERPLLAKLGRKIENAFKYCFDRVLFKLLSFLSKYFLSAKKEYLRKIRKQRFVTFSSDHIVEKDYGLSKYYFPPSFLANFDFFVLGGDQVWNPFFEYANIPGSVFFLPFAGSGKMAFMFSTSFGISKDMFFEKMGKIPGLADAYRGALDRMSFISCREDTGMEIVNSLTHVKGQVMLDPTMMLTREEWLLTAQTPDFLASRIDGKKGYALLFFLGEGIPDFLKGKIQKICADKNLEPISLNDPLDEAYVADPSEFLYLAANADVIYTDSFHGAAFSILFETPFFVFEYLGSRASMNSRFDTLLRKFNLEGRSVKNAEKVSLEDSSFNMDFSYVREILSEEREKAVRFLKTAIEKMQNLDVDSI